jgi:hypothetical protein
MRVQISYLDPKTHNTAPPESYRSLDDAKNRLRELYPDYYLTAFHFDSVKPLNTVADAFSSRQEADQGGTPIGNVCQSPLG